MGNNLSIKQRLVCQPFAATRVLQHGDGECSKMGWPGQNFRCRFGRRRCVVDGTLQGPACVSRLDPFWEDSVARQKWPCRIYAKTRPIGNDGCCLRHTIFGIVNRDLRGESECDAFAYGGAARKGVLAAPCRRAVPWVELHDDGCIPDRAGREAACRMTHAPKG